MSTRSNIKTILVDFDGVLSSYQHGWQGYGAIADPPVPGAMFWLERMCRLFTVKIVSGRAKTWRGRRAIRRWLKRYGGGAWPLFKTIKITSKKVDDYVLMVDDRAWHFRGDNFPDISTVMTFIPWCKRRR